MRIDQPICRFNYCKYWFDFNCNGDENKRRSCKLIHMDDEIEKLYDSIKETYRIIEEMRNG
jgi:hypothetical protein